jgi:acyl-CoA thioesterase FadM
LTRSLTVRFRRPVRIGEPLVFTGWVESDDGQRALARGACHVGDELRADAEAQFARPRS